MHVIHLLVLPDHKIKKEWKWAYSYEGKWTSSRKTNPH